MGDVEKHDIFLISMEKTSLTSSDQLMIALIADGLSKTHKNI